MPVTVVATPVGDASCNSYITVAEGDAFADLELGTLTWTAPASTTDRKGMAVIAAATYLDQLLWIGSKTTATQSRLWPREKASCGEKSYANNVIPPEVKYGNFLLAEALLADPTVMSGNSPTIQGELITGIPNADLKRAKLDIMEVEFREAAGGSSRVNALSVLPTLRDLFGCLCASTPAGGVAGFRIVRG
jgi:hypothetical protein